jgi:hypothetical protein
MQRPSDASQVKCGVWRIYRLLLGLRNDSVLDEMWCPFLVMEFL